MEPKKAPREMTGAELNSMLKSSINFKSLGGMRCEELNLTEEDMQWWRECQNRYVCALGIVFHSWKRRMGAPQ